MKKLILGLGLAVAGLTCSVASAYDYYQGDCCPAPYNDCYNDCCGSDFDGFYFGGNIGVVTHTGYRNDLDGFLTDNSGWTISDTDVTVGLQLGYDWNCGCSLFGLVFDWNWANNDRKIPDNPNGTSENNFLKTELDWFLTLRARAGITVCDCLFYLTGGAAAIRVETTWQDEPDRFHRRNTKWGWTGGVGAEYLLGCNWSVGAEILFIHIDQYKRTFTDSTDTPFAFAHSDSLWVGRVLLNYRFGDLFGCFCR